MEPDTNIPIPESIDKSDERRCHTYERDGERRPRNTSGDHHQEHGEREQNGNTEGDFLAGFRRKTEPDHDEHGEHDAGEDDVHDVELVPPFEVQSEDDVGVPVPSRTEDRDVPL